MDIGKCSFSESCCSCPVSSRSVWESTWIWQSSGIAMGSTQMIRSLVLSLVTPTYRKNWAGYSSWSQIRQERWPKTTWLRGKFSPNSHNSLTRITNRTCLTWYTPVVPNTLKDAHQTMLSSQMEQWGPKDASNKKSLEICSARLHYATMWLQCQKQKQLNSKKPQSPKLLPEKVCHHEERVWLIIPRIRSPNWKRQVLMKSPLSNLDISAEWSCWREIGTSVQCKMLPEILSPSTYWQASHSQVNLKRWDVSWSQEIPIGLSTTWKELRSSWSTRSRQVPVHPYWNHVRIWLWMVFVRLCSLRKCCPSSNLTLSCRNLGKLKLDSGTGSNTFFASKMSSKEKWIS